MFPLLPSGNFVMARYGDRGPYSADNVRVISLSQNQTESWAVRNSKRRRLVVREVVNFESASRAQRWMVLIKPLI